MNIETPKLRRVIVESPFAGDVRANVEYARSCIRDCLLRGETPFASHLLYTQAGVLDDTVPDERALGINAGHAWMFAADAVVVYEDRGISRGMLEGIRRAKAIGVPVEHRSIQVAASGADVVSFTGEPRLKREQFSEQHYFIIEAALQLGFVIIDDDATQFKVSDEWLIEFASRIERAAANKTTGGA